MYKKKLKTNNIIGDKMETILFTGARSGIINKVIDNSYTNIQMVNDSSILSKYDRELIDAKSSSYG